MIMKRADTRDRGNNLFSRPPWSLSGRLASFSVKTLGNKSSSDDVLSGKEGV